MSHDVKTGLILNSSGVGLFLLWLVFQNALPLALSITVALVFCGLLGSSLFYLFRAARRTSEADTRHSPSPQSKNS